MNWIANNDTPGPTDYDIKTSLMDENRNKHYGFVEKSNRFQSQPKTALDDKERGVLRGIEENLRPIVKKNDDVKSKKEKGWKEMYSKITKIHEKEIKTLEEKISRIETMFHTVVKEKSHLLSSVAVKEKEFLELQAKHEMLLISLEKADKVAQGYVDKACKADTFEKKLNHVNKSTCKMKNIADKKLLQENEELNGKVAKANVDRFALEKAQKEYKLIQKELSKSCESFETQRLAYLGRINELESELENVGIKNQKVFSEMEELSKIAKKAEYEKEIESDKCAKLKSSLQELQGKNAEVSILEKNLVFLKEEVNELKAEKQALETEKIQTKVQHDKMVSSLGSEIKSLKSQLEEQTHRIESGKGLMEDLSSKLETADKKIYELKHHNESLAQERILYSKQKETSLKAMEQMQNEVQGLRQQLADGETNFSSLLEKERQISSGLSQKIRDQSGNISSIQEKLTACISELENERAEYKVNLSILKSTLEKSETELKMEICQLNEKLSELADNGIKKEAYLQSLLAEEKQTSGRLSTKVRDQTERINSMESQLEIIISDKKQEQQELSNEFNALETKYRESETELATAKTKLHDLEIALSAGKSSHANETAGLLSQISDLEFIKEKLNGQVQESQSLIQEQNLVIQKLEDSINEKTMDRQSLSVQYDTMEEELKDLLKKYTTVTISFEEEKSLHEQTKQMSQRRISELEKELDEFYRNASDKDKLLQSLLESEKEKSYALSREIGDMESKVKSLEGELLSAKQLHKEEVERLEMEVVAINFHQKELMNEISKSQLHILKEKDESISESYKAMERSLTEDINNLQSKNQALLLELSESASENAGKAQLIDNLQNIIDQKEVSISSMVEKLCSSNEELKYNCDEVLRLELKLKEADENLLDASSSFEKKIQLLQVEASDMKSANTLLHKKVEELKDELITSSNIVKEKDAEIKLLADKAKELNSIIEEMAINVTNMETKIQFLESSKERNAEEMLIQLESSRGEALLLKEAASAKEEQIKSLNDRLNLKDLTIIDLESDMDASKKNLKALENIYQEKELIFNETQEKFTGTIYQLKEQLEEKQIEIKAIQEILNSSRKEFYEVQARSSELSASLDTQNYRVLELEAKLNDGNEVIQNLQKNEQSNLTLIKRSEDKISDLLETNQTLVKANETIAAKEKALKEEMEHQMKCYSQLESKMQSKIKDHEKELGEVHESLARNREEFKIERKYFNDQMVVLSVKLNKEIELKETERKLCKELSDNLDFIKKEKHDLESKLNDISAKHAEEDFSTLKELKQEVENLNSALEFKTNLLKDLESKLEDCQSRLSVAELRLLNELSSKDMHFKSFEDRLKSKCSEVENLTKSHLEMKKTLLKIKEENKNLISESEKNKSSMARYKEVERLVLLEKKNLESGHKDSITQVCKYKKEISDLKSLVKDLTESNSELSNLYTTQSELMTSQGALNNSEMEKISHLNAELAGHSNSRQKIKYVSNIKQENLALKKENSNLLIEREQLNQKIQSLLADQASLGPII